MTSPGTKNGEIQTRIMCTMGGVLQVDVRDGEILRLRPLQLTEEEIKDAKWQIDAKGKIFEPSARTTVAPYSICSRRKVYNPNRIKYPMIRKGFKPGGKSSVNNRGKGEFQRISWNEAIDIGASEIKRICDTYGPAAINPMHRGHHTWGTVHSDSGGPLRFFDMLQTSEMFTNPNSWEGWFWGAVHAYGFQNNLGVIPQDDLLEDTLKNSEMLIYWSSDPEKTSWSYQGQESAVWRLWVKELGIKQIFIDPFCNYTAGLRADKWIAPKPSTDTAMAMAIAHTWITEDTYDKEYIKTHTSGFKEWKDHILGKDGTDEKSPEWADQICDVRAGTIRAIAREWASKRTSLAIRFGGACRTPYGHEWTRCIVLLQAMQGLGKPGVNIWTGYSGAPADKEFQSPSYKAPNTPMILAADKVPKNPTEQVTYRLHMPEIILDPPVSWFSAGNGCAGMGADYQFKKYTYPTEGYPEIKMIYKYGNQHFSTLPAGNRWAAMYKSPKLEFVLVQSPWGQGEAEFGDLLLPACTNFERNDLSEWARVKNNQDTNFRIVVYQQKCIEPWMESKTDYEIFTLLAEKLGFKDEYSEGKTEEDWIRGTFDKTSISEHMGYEEFKKKGYYIVPFPKDYKPKKTLTSFYETGEGLDTPTGKIEFLSERIKKFMPDDQERPPLPRYTHAFEGPHVPLTEKYPLTMISPHAKYSFHTQGENVSWIRWIPLHRVHRDGYNYWPVQIHPEDAEKRGIKQNDLVKAFNDRAEVILIAQITQKIRPGSVLAVTAAIYDPIEPGKVGSVDKGGAVNLLMPKETLSKNVPGQVTQALVEIKKLEG